MVICGHFSTLCSDLMVWAVKPFACYKMTSWGEGVDVQRHLNQEYPKRFKGSKLSNEIAAWNSIGAALKTHCETMALRHSTICFEGEIAPPKVRVMG